MSALENKPLDAEAACIAILRAAALALAGKVGGRYVSICLTYHAHKAGEHCRHEWTAYVDGDKHRSSQSLAVAVSECCEHMTPAVRAAVLRGRAAADLAEAEKLEASA